MRVVYINSTVPVRQGMRRRGEMSPLHYWGYRPRAEDVLLAHRINRAEITLRAKLGGLDLQVLFRTWQQLNRGAGAVYAVTQPDIWQALPWLRRRFPGGRFVTWAWTDWEVDRHLHRLRACDHVLCLTEGAKRRLDESGMGERSALAIWGCEPAHYRVARAVACDTDVFIAGLTARDGELIKRGVASGRYSVCLTRTSRDALGLFDAAGGTRLEVVDVDDEATLISSYHRCRVTWIPLKAGDPHPSGYTNLIESLLCGTSAVIADTSLIPERVLSLSGVFRYRAGDWEDFRRCTDEALGFMAVPGARGRVADAAAHVLNGSALERAIRHHLGLAATCESSP